MLKLNQVTRGDVLLWLAAVLAITLLGLLTAVLPAAASSL